MISPPSPEHIAQAESLGCQIYKGLGCSSEAFMQIRMIDNLRLRIAALNSAYQNTPSRSQAEVLYALELRRTEYELEPAKDTAYKYADAALAALRNRFITQEDFTAIRRAFVETIPEGEYLSEVLQHIADRKPTPADSIHLNACIATLNAVTQAASTTSSLATR